MAKQTYLQLSQALRKELGETGTGPSAVTSQTGIYEKIVHWIAEADYAIQSLFHDWNFLYDDTTFSTTTIASTKDYTAPSDLGVWEFDTFYLNHGTSTSKKLEYMEFSDYYTTYAADTITNDKPTSYCIKPNGNVILYPTPDDAYTLTAHYYKKPARMTANTDTSNIPEEYERCILARAKMMYSEEQEFPLLYQQASQEYQEQLMRLESNGLHMQEQRFRGASGLDIVVRPE